jgi:ubiquitin-activating enzyme E1 C
VLKNLALSGIRNIDVIDMDTIDVTNLNRQFLFRVKDVGGKKAEVAANFIMKRCPNVTVTAHTCMIQEKDEDFYRQFAVIIGGLDNIEARRWLNSQLHEMLIYEEDVINPASVIPFIDGGSEGFKGQARVIIPGTTSCFDCTLDMFPPQLNFQLCTIAETPRKPEHCIAYAMLAVQKSLAEGPDSMAIRTAWETKFGEKATLDKDNADHMVFIFEQAMQRANKFKIEGITLQLTSGVVKRIIPAIASTNAVIAAACVNEAWKYLGYSSHLLDNYMMFNGTTGVYSYTYRTEKKPDCLVCCRELKKLEVPKSSNLQILLNELVDKYKFSKPSVSTSKSKLYIANPESLRKQTEANLQKPMSALVQSGDVIVVTDPIFVIATEFEIILT